MARDSVEEESQALMNNDAEFFAQQQLSRNHMAI